MMPRDFERTKLRGKYRSRESKKIERRSIRAGQFSFFETGRLKYFHRNPQSKIGDEQFSFFFFFVTFPRVESRFERGFTSRYGISKYFSPPPLCSNRGPSCFNISPLNYRPLSPSCNGINIGKT